MKPTTVAGIRSLPRDAAVAHEIMRKRRVEEFCPPDCSPTDDRLFFDSLDIIDIEYLLILEQREAAVERKPT